MPVLAAILVSIVAIAVLYRIAGRIGVPYPILFVLGGLALAFIPGLPHIEFDSELILVAFLPPLLFIAATETPTRDLRRWLAPILRLAFLLVIVTIVVVAIVAQNLVPSLGWAAALTLGAIVAPTDPLAATAIFRRIGAPRIVSTLVEGEALLNDASALVAYRFGVVAVATGAFVLAQAIGAFAVAVVGGVLIGLIVGWIAVQIIARIDDPLVEVLLSSVVPFAAYLPAEAVGASGVLAVVTTGVIIGSRLGKILSASSRTLWLSTWKIAGFVLNGFVFVLIGLELPTIVAGLSVRDPLLVLSHVAAIAAVVVVTRFVFVIAASYLPNSARRIIARTNPQLAKRLTFVVAWSGMRGAVSLAAALALPADFPERSLIILTTLGVILVTLVGQGLTLPAIVRRVGWDGRELDGDEGTAARTFAYNAGLHELRRQRERWPTHQPLLDRLESGLNDRLQHLASEGGEETPDQIQERLEHEEIQQDIIDAERTAVIALRDSGDINDETLREVERELDLEELRMEG